MLVQEIINTLEHHSLVRHGKMIGKPDRELVNEAIIGAIDLLKELQKPADNLKLIGYKKGEFIYIKQNP